ncbi:MAG: hypothetical protein COV10_02700 [Candidatus Vogelbacteria bacterium CG10_big_fil_rev_8_21_14_0_10_51_16]|uniref:Transglutaminase-like domain-containing protein n=1 Tax=Candidatus Vogelbacteria bacterium CG10_big_fil_rev_8_21_14_0_10_51_16 TaxID=1975045 RepID=A0A2H0RE05_9BACT|nr:MAG: hypothetical protein COV10_02700 [Candidatus Vogelbacteria bacterium CG10_big_fil_rev_8_21_14_0_10_51_16]
MTIIDKPQDKIINQEGERDALLFANLSGVGVEAVEDLKSMRAEIPDDLSPVEQAHAFRHRLISSGFVYDHRTFELGEMLAKKNGNCLGYALLMGSVLEMAGTPVGYELITNPKDAVYEYELDLFQQLQRGEHFEFDRPVLPEADDIPTTPFCRFVPLEHPTLVLGSERARFETTSLDEEGENPVWAPDAERSIDVTFSELASNVLVDKVKVSVDLSSQPDWATMRKQIEVALGLYPGNREAWHYLWQVNKEQGDFDGMRHALRRYEEIGGDDSRYYFGLYLMGADENVLDKALERCPAYMPAYVAKYVELAENPRDAKFSLAVAAWCIANSGILSLEKFYRGYAPYFEYYYGAETHKKLVGSFAG